MNKFFSLTLILFICCSTAALVGQQKFNFQVKPWSNAEINAPGRGAQFWNSVYWDNVWAPQVPNGVTTGQSSYRRFLWADMESGQGTYTFLAANNSLDLYFRQAISRGETFSFGIMPVCEMCTFNYDGARAGYPQYLHNLMQSETVKDWKSSGGVWIPNWNSENYLSRYEALLDTIAKFIANRSYNGIPYSSVLEYIDVRGYGNYGEWHNYPYYKEIPTAAAATTTTLKRIIDAHSTYFPNNPLILMEGLFVPVAASYVPLEVAYYGMTSSNKHGLFGWRRDNLGEATEDKRLANNVDSYNGYRFDTAIVNRYKYAMVTGEPINGGSQYKNAKGVAYYDLRREINLYHIAGFGNGNFPQADIASTAVRDTLREAFKITGYRLNLTGGSMNSTLYQNSSFNITLKWRNAGNAPLYQKRWKVTYQLLDANNVVVQSWNSVFNPYLYLPSPTDSVVSDNLTLGNIPVASGYKITIKIIDTTGYLPPLPLAMNTPARNADGSYTLRSKISVAANTTNFVSVPARPDTLPNSKNDPNGRAKADMMDVEEVKKTDR